MNYRITVEVEKAKDERGYQTWAEMYQQVVPELNLRTLVSHINSTRKRRKTAIKEEQ